MDTHIGQLVSVRPGAFSVQERAVAIVTKVHSEQTVDVTVFPSSGVMPFTMTSVKKVAEDYREHSNKEIFWHLLST